MKSKVWKILLSFVLAFGLWIYVITVVSPGSEKTYYDIPVILQNEATLQREGLMITSIEDNSITLQLSGNRTDLNELNENNINIFANLSGILSPGVHRVNYTVNLPGNIASNAVTTLSKEPNMLVIRVEKRVTQIVPVEVEYVGSVPTNFIADKENAELDYPVIEVKGPESLVSQVKSARIQVNLQDKTEPVVGEFAYTLCGENGQPLQLDEQLITTNVKDAKGEKTINVYLNIRRYKDLKLSLTVVAGGGATEDTCEIKINPQTIRISGSEEQLASMKELNLGTVELGSILQDTQLTLPIVLPEGVTNITGRNEAVVDVKFPNLTTKTLKVTQIEGKNQPKNLISDIMTQEVEVTVRGPIKLLKNLKESDLRLVVDFTNAQAGSFTMPAVVMLPESYADVGAVGSYTVSVTLTQKPSAEE